MKAINASKFKERRLALLDNLELEGMVITKHGKPIARVIPETSNCVSLIGSMKGKIRIKGDMLSTGVGWHSSSPMPKPLAKRPSIRGK